MYFIFSACSCMLDDSKFTPQLLYEYDKSKYVACIPSAYFKTKSELINHLSTKFCIFETPLPKDGLEREHRSPERAPQAREFSSGKQGSDVFATEGQTKVSLEDISVSNKQLPLDDIKIEAINDADAVTTLGMYMSKRLTNFSGCCDPILIYNSEIKLWEPTEIVIKHEHSEEDNKAFREGKLPGDEYIKRPLVPVKMKGEHRYLVPREFYKTWYEWDETNNDENNY